MEANETVQAQKSTGVTRLGAAWREHRLLLYSGFIGIVGGLGAQLFVWALNLAERVLLSGIAGYRAPEPGTLNPEASIGPHGL